MRLAADHEARADALLLMHKYSNDDADRYKKFVESLSAEKIDFGKTPSTPVDTV